MAKNKRNSELAAYPIDIDGLSLKELSVEMDIEVVADEALFASFKHAPEIINMLVKDIANKSMLRTAFKKATYIEKLEHSFDNVSFGKYSGVVTCVVPNMYWILPERKHPLGTLMHTQGQGDTEEESAKSLFNQIVKLPVCRHISKEQDRYEPIVEGRYSSVNHYHPEHSHDNGKLLDFNYVEIDPFEGKLVTSDEIKLFNHVHLRPLHIRT